MTEKISYIPARLKNSAVGGHVAGADQIIDDELQLTQSQINSIVLGDAINTNLTASPSVVFVGEIGNFQEDISDLQSEIDANSDGIEEINDELDGETLTTPSFSIEGGITKNSGLPNTNSGVLRTDLLKIDSFDGMYHLSEDIENNEYLAITLYYYSSKEITQSSYLGASSLTAGNINANVKVEESIETINGRYEAISGSIENAKYIVISIQNTTNGSHTSSDAGYVRLAKNYKVEGIKDKVNELEPLPEIVSQLSADVEVLKKYIELNIDDEFTMYIGDTLQIFKYPLTLIANYRHYGISISGISRPGYQTNTYATLRDTPRYCIITGNAVGDAEVTINVTDDNLNVLISKTVVIHVITAVSPSTKKNILLIGDSITQGVNGRIPNTNYDITYADEVKRLLTTENPEQKAAIAELGFSLPNSLGLTNINLIGTKGAATGRNEGYSGWTAGNFNGEDYEGAQSPFKFNGAIDYNQYLAQDSIYDDVTRKGVDVIYIMLGINNRSNFLAVDGKVDLDFSTAKSQLITMLTYIKQQLHDDSTKAYYNPNLKVVLLSYVFADLDSYDDYTLADNTTFKDGVLMAKQFQTVAKINAEVAAMDEFSDFVTSRIIAPEIDSENSYSVREIIKNPYLAATEETTHELHPNHICYRMIGAAVARDILGRLQ